MTEAATSRAHTRRSWVHGSLAVLRVLLIVTILIALYYLLPFERSLDVPLVASVIGGLVLVAGLAVVETRAILRSAQPGLKAVEALAIVIPLLILTFAATYVLISDADESVFTEALTKTDALYFSMTVFSSVGFGDISAVSQGARLVVSAQIAADLLMLGLGVRIMVGAAKRGRKST